MTKGYPRLDPCMTYHSKEKSPHKRSLINFDLQMTISNLWVEIYDDNAAFVATMIVVAMIFCILLFYLFEWILELALRKFAPPSRNADCDRDSPAILSKQSNENKNRSDITYR